MNQLDRLEALAQRLIEGVFSRVFRVRSVSLEDHSGEKQRSKTEESLALLTRTDMAARWTLQFEDRQIRLGEPVVAIGRALDNDIILSDPTVSRYHAQLRWRNGCYHLYLPERVAPNGIGNGVHHEPNNRPVEIAKPTKRLPAQTKLNQRVIVQATLDSGDLLTLGETTIRIVMSEHAS